MRKRTILAVAMLLGVIALAGLVGVLQMQQAIIR